MDQNERFKLIPSIYALLVRDGKILLLRRQNTGFEDGNYGLVAGHADGGETLRQAMVREAFEEAGIKIAPDDLNLAATLHRRANDWERIDFFFAVKKWSGEIKNMEPKKCLDLSWFPLDQLPQNIIEYIRLAIECYQQRKNYFEYGWDR